MKKNMDKGQSLIINNKEVKDKQKKEEIIKLRYKKRIKRKWFWLNIEKKVFVITNKRITMKDGYIVTKYGEKEAEVVKAKARKNVQ